MKGAMVQGSQPITVAVMFPETDLLTIPMTTSRMTYSVL
jgi:hypothetical protein